ncbi:MAG: pentapeptide repeat-containing protein, partial [Pseudolabrys sp.]
MTNRVAAMLALCACAFVQPGMAQDMMRHVDLNSPDMTTAEMTRDEVAAIVKAATPGHPADFTGKKLSGLDLSGLN